MPRILLVEDDPVLRKAFSIMLERYDYQVDVAENAKQAEQFLNKQEPDLILLDINLPDMDGLSFIEKNLAEAGRSGVKVIVFTNYDSDEMRQEAESLGIDRYMVKAQNSPMEIVEAVGAVLAEKDAA